MEEELVQKLVQTTLAAREEHDAKVGVKQEQALLEELVVGMTVFKHIFCDRNLGVALVAWIGFCCAFGAVAYAWDLPIRF